MKRKKEKYLLEEAWIMMAIAAGMAYIGFPKKERSRY